VSFKLSQAGEQISIFAPNGRLVDSITFGAQTSDVSQGRWPDGADFITLLGHPTPDGPNQATAQTGDIRIMTAQLSLTGTLTLAWTAEPGKSYEVQGSSNLTSWTTVSAAPIQAVGPVASFTIPTASHAPQFYRVLSAAQ